MTAARQQRFALRLDLESGVPVYRQIIDQVLGGIAAGSLRAGAEGFTLQELIRRLKEMSSERGK